MDLDKQSYNIQELICLIGADLPQDIKENDLLTALLSKVATENDSGKRHALLENVLLVFPHCILSPEEFSVCYDSLKAFKDVFQNLLEINTSCAQNASKVGFIKENFNDCILILEIMDTFLEELVYASSVTLQSTAKLLEAVTVILLLTFQHCRKSNEIYGECFEQLSEILALFRRAQDVQAKMLNILNKCEITQEDIQIFTESTKNFLLEMSSVLSGMNIKSMADTWKNYVTLVQKHQCSLESSNYSISASLKLLNEEINKHIERIETDNKDEKELTHTSKVVGFLIKVLSKVAELFSKGLSQHFNCILAVAASLFRFSCGDLSHKVISTNFRECFEKNIVKPFFSFFDSLLERTDFCEYLSDEQTSDCDTVGFLILYGYILEKISHSGKSWGLIEFCGFFRNILRKIGRSQTEFFIVVTVSDSKLSLYDFLVVTVVTAVCATNMFNEALQEILYENVLSENECLSLFSNDVFFCCVRLLPSVQQYNVVCNLVNYKQLFKSTLCKRLDFLSLESLIRKCYELLDDEEKIEFIENFDLQRNLDLWTVIGLKHFPLSHRYQLDNLLDKGFEILQLLKNDKFAFADFQTLCQLLELLSTINYTQFGCKTKRLIESLVKIWDFETEDKDKLASSLFCNFIEMLLKCTAHLIMEFNNPQLLLILSQITILTAFCPDVKVMTLKLLETLSRKHIKGVQERNAILSKVSDIFIDLLKDRNVFISAAATECLVSFLNTSNHESEVTDALCKVPTVRELVSSYVQQQNRMEDCLECFEYFHPYKHIHVCPRKLEDDVPKCKKFKFDEDSVAEQMNKLRQNVEALLSTCEGRVMSVQNKSVLNDIISQLQKLK